MVNYQYADETAVKGGSAGARELLARCLADGQVIAGKHFREELENELLVTPAAWDVLHKGQIYNEPEFHVGKQEWNYRIEGHEPGGKYLAVVFSFKSKEVAFLVTAFCIERKRK